MRDIVDIVLDKAARNLRMRLRGPVLFPDGTDFDAARRV
jgi:hypothetical protein